MNWRSTIGNLITGGELRDLRQQVRYAEAGLYVARENLNQFAAEQRAAGWVTPGNQQCVFSREAVRLAAAAGNWLYWNNPLVQRGVHIQADYVFGQGFTISSPAEAVQAVLDDFVNGLRNRNIITEPEAAARRDVELQISGNLMFAVFTDDDGHVDVRVLEPNEFEDIIRNPEDRAETWYYKRTWTTEKLDQVSGEIRSTTETVYHPDVNYRPSGADKWETIGGHEVLWDAPVFHFAPSAIGNMKWGMCEFYSAQAWAKSYWKFLENRLTVAEALSRFVLKFTQKATGAAKGAFDAASAIVARLQQGRSRAGDKAGEEEEIGNAAVLAEGGDVEAINVRGATINPDDGRRVALMAYAGFGFPETFWGDVSVGTLATAASLDRNTEFKIERRRKFWRDVLHSLALYAVMQAALSSNHKFQAEVDFHGGTPKITINGKPVVIEVKFPEIIEHDMVQVVTAITTAAQYIPDPPTIAGLLLHALKVPNAPAILKGLKFPKPEAQPAPGDKTNPEDKNAK